MSLRIWDLVCPRETTNYQAISYLLWSLKESLILRTQSLKRWKKKKRGHKLLTIFIMVGVGRQFSIGLLHWCTSCNQKHWLPLSCVIFTRRQPALKDEIVSLCQEKVPSRKYLGSITWLLGSLCRNCISRNRFKKMLILWLLLFLWPRSFIFSAIIFKTC